MNSATQLPQSGGEAAEQIRTSMDGKSVCPFCGSVNADGGGPCLHCGMDNTSAARKATKSRIGPWYVLQQRNPAAPGMRFDTLLMFIRKGRVRPRSVVRGPTTHQLWRFAAQVKGLSREFGLCHSCAGEIGRTTSICPQCNRSQEPVGNPDALLEGAEVTPPAVHAPDLQSNEPALRIARHALLDPEIAPNPELATADPTTAGPQRAKGADSFLSARDLAAAFQLDFDPKAEFEPADGDADDAEAGANKSLRVGTVRRQRRGHPILKTLAAVVLLGASGVAAAICFSPSIRARSMRWYDQADGKVNQWAASMRGGEANSHNNGQTANPAGIPRLSVGDVVTTQPGATPQPGGVSGADAAAIQAALHHPSNNQSGSAMHGVDTPPNSPSTTLPPVSPVHSPDTSSKPGPALTQTAADPTAKVRALYNRGIDAEGNGDFVTAVSNYEQIKRFPQGYWPIDLDLRLRIASARLPRH